MIVGAIIFSIAYLFIFINGIISSRLHTLEQTWLINLRDTCGFEYETDENGLLIANSKGMYTGTVVTSAEIFGIFGLFVGQILFRTKGYGKLLHDAYTSGSRYFYQLVYCAIIVLLAKLPLWFYEVFSENTGDVVDAIFIIALPRFIIFSIMSLYLPALSARLFMYPQVLRTPEIDYMLTEEKMKAFDAMNSIDM